VAEPVPKIVTLLSARRPTVCRCSSRRLWPDSAKGRAGCLCCPDIMTRRPGEPASSPAKAAKITLRSGRAFAISRASSNNTATPDALSSAPGCNCPLAVRARHRANRTQDDRSSALRRSMLGRSKAGFRARQDRDHIPGQQRRSRFARHAEGLENNDRRHVLLVLTAKDQGARNVLRL